MAEKVSCPEYFHVVLKPHALASLALWAAEVTARRGKLISVDALVRGILEASVTAWETSVLGGEREVSEATFRTMVEWDHDAGLEGATEEAMQADREGGKDAAE
jgi:hypothetical protein